MEAKIKIWVQPVGDLWNIRHLGTVLYRTRTMEDGIKEAQILLADMLKRIPTESEAEIILETKEGVLRTIPFRKEDF